MQIGYAQALAPGRSNTMDLIGRKHKHVARKHRIHSRFCGIGSHPLPYQNDLKTGMGMPNKGTLYLLGFYIPHSQKRFPALQHQFSHRNHHTAPRIRRKVSIGYHKIMPKTPLDLDS